MVLEDTIKLNTTTERFHYHLNKGKTYAELRVPETRPFEGFTMAALSRLDLLNYGFPDFILFAKPS